MPDTATELAADEGMPWALLPSEVVCTGCNLTRHRHLPECPICKESAR